MTALIGGSLLLIAGSALALVIGWTNANESLIWTSIGASVGAAIMLSLGYYRSKAEATRRPVPRSQARPAAAAAPATPPAEAATRPSPVVAGDDDAGRVIAYADRSRFHRPGCRYSSIPGGERISREAAVRRGYDPCSVCKP